ncbi:MAG TPA: amidohydrolase family protein [Terriglobales bacterium]|nr:amidohydrolase family protein [Terriglobales bacterium]
MKPYLALIRMDLRLALRQKSVIFFNYLFPLIFFITFAQIMHADRGGAMTQILTMVVILGVLGNGLFGAGMRTVQDREANVLRRYKVTPITPAPILVSLTIVGWMLFMPFVVAMFCLAHFMYHMPWPATWLSIFLFISFGIMAFRAIGTILASVANSMQESQILVQLIYLPMLLLSGATFPASIFPNWLIVVTQFLPATYLVSGMQGMMLRQENLLANAEAVGALLLTVVVGLFISFKLFRWEKEEKIRNSAKLWILGVMLPFVVLGTWQAYTRQNVVRTRILARQMERGNSYLVRGARIFVGDGKVIDNGAVLIRGGKIAEVYEGEGPDPQSVRATPIEAAGKTILPGLIDAHIHLAAPGGFYPDMSQYKPEPAMLRALAAYLYSGVTAVRSVGDPLDMILKVRSRVNSGERLGAELFACGPLFTTPGGHGTEYFKGLPANVQQQAMAQFVRTPASPEEARRQVDELKKSGVDCIKAVLESGGGGTVFNRMDVSVFKAIVQEAHAQGLPVAVHTGDVRDVTDALAAGADSIEHGSAREEIPDALFAQMAAQHVFYDPTLSVEEAIKEFVAGRTNLLQRSLVQQVGPADLLEGTERAITSKDAEALRQRMGQFPVDPHIGADNLRRAFQHGVTLITGSDAGNYLVIHGPTVQREVELWVENGIPPMAALQAATYNAARALHAENHIGAIRKGNDADMLLVDGDPLADISAVERISIVFFKGEHVDRSELFNQE